jgi:hypothetical protein
MVGLAWWSQTAASNSTQDSTVNWAEGQSPSTVNDSARAMMASAIKTAASRLALKRELQSLHHKMLAVRR